MRMLENLETRRLLSATLTVTPAGALTLNGNGANDTITVRENLGAVHVEYFDAGGNFVTNDLGGVTSIAINGGGGSDRIFFTGNSMGASIHGDNQTGVSSSGGKNGGDGETGGNGNGGAGNDFLSVSDDGTGTSTVNGDNGDDTLTVLHGNNTVVLGDSGNDLIYLNTAFAGGSNVVDGGNGNDTITVYSGSNTINGGNGKDTVILDTTAGVVQADQSITDVEKLLTF